MIHFKSYADALADRTSLNVSGTENACCYVATGDENRINSTVVADLALFAFELLGGRSCCICCCRCWRRFFLRVFFLEPIDELMESRPWILQMHDPRTIVLLSRQQFVEEHPLMTTHLKDAPMVLFEVILEFGKCTWVYPEDPCTIGTIHLCNFGEGVPSVLAMAHHHIIVLEPKQPCEQKIIEVRLREASQSGPFLSKRHGSEELGESCEDLVGPL